MIIILFLEMVAIIVIKRKDLYVTIQINYFNIVKDVKIIIVQNVLYKMRSKYVKNVLKDIILIHHKVVHNVTRFVLIA